MTVELRDTLGETLAAWDTRCVQAPEGRPTHRVPNLRETLALEGALLGLAEHEQITTGTLRAELQYARFSGLPPREAVDQAVQRSKEHQ